MLERLKKMMGEVMGRMFPVATISDALGVGLAASPVMEQNIGQWMRLFEARGGLGLPAAVASELARLATIECEVTVTGGVRARYFSARLAPVLRDLRAQTEFGLAGGGLVLKPYWDGDAVAVSYCHADAFYPVAYDSTGRMSSVVFLEQLVRGETRYSRIEYHHMERGGCVIENKAFAAARTLGGAVLGGPVALSAVEEWARLEPMVRIENVDRLLVGYFKTPLANTVEPGSPLGVSAFARAVELMAQADAQWQRIVWEYEGTELAIHADATLFQRDGGGNLILPKGKERLYRPIHGDVAPREKMFPFSPEIRDTALFNGLNNMLKRIEFVCGLAYGTLSDPQNVDKTAEEIRASKQRSFALVRDVQKALQAALDDLVYAMDIWATLGGATRVSAYRIAYGWDDSIVNDPVQRKQMFWGYVVANRFPMWRYLVEFEGYTEDEARAVVGEMSAGAVYGDG